MSPNIDSRIFWVSPIVVMVIGLFPLPIGYYTLVRLVVCGCAIYYLIQYIKSKEQTLLWVFGFIAILYNPIFPIYLYEKAIWIVINIIAAVVFYKQKDPNSTIIPKISFSDKKIISESTTNSVLFISIILIGILIFGMIFSHYN
mgnify:CR=1 FL=1|tara:strand:- start:951 stop:1382 length:432 start_codon:yes stop_codon:yes gene_type:complete